MTEELVMGMQTTYAFSKLYHRTSIFELHIQPRINQARLDQKLALLPAHKEVDETFETPSLPLLIKRSSSSRSEFEAVSGFPMNSCKYHSLPWLSDFGHYEASGFCTNSGHWGAALEWRLVAKDHEEKHIAVLPRHLHHLIIKPKPLDF